MQVCCRTCAVEGHLVSSLASSLLEIRFNPFKLFELGFLFQFYKLFLKLVRQNVL